jgi:hypothetical protein
MQPSSLCRRAVGILAVMFVLACASAQAEAYVWQSNGADTDWFNPNNWQNSLGVTGAGFPGDGDTADISQSGSRSPTLANDVLVDGITLGQTFNSRSITIAATRSLTVKNLTLQRGDILGSGTLRIPAGGTLNNNDPQAVPGTNNVTSNIINAGTVMSTVGTLNLGTNYTQTAGMTKLAGGSITGTLTLTGGGINGVGTVTGTLNNPSGTFSPGNSAGSVTVSGDYTQGSTGVLNLELGGTTAGQFDTFTIGGNANLGGVLQVTLINGFTMSDEDTFDVGGFNGRSGNFDTFNVGDTNLRNAFVGNRVILGRAASITSVLTASGTVGSAFTYNITGRGKSPVTLSATGLPAGLTLSGAQITGTPTAAGVFMVALSAANTFGSDNETLVITINNVSTTPPGPSPDSGTGSAMDTDSDGFSNEIELALGTNPNLATSTPFGTSPAGAPLSLTLSKLTTNLNFASAGKDMVSLQGTVSVPAGFNVDGQTVIIDVGGVIKSFTLDSRGKSATGANDTFKISIKSRGGNVEAQEAKFIAKFNKGDFDTALTDEGLTNADARLASKNIFVQVFFNGRVFTISRAQLYTARTGKNGKTKDVR